MLKLDVSPEMLRTLEKLDKSGALYFEMARAVLDIVERELNEHSGAIADAQRDSDPGALAGLSEVVSYEGGPW